MKYPLILLNILLALLLGACSSSDNSKNILPRKGSYVVTIKSPQDYPQEVGDSIYKYFHITQPGSPDLKMVSGGQLPEYSLDIEYESKPIKYAGQDCFFYSVKVTRCKFGTQKPLAEAYMTQNCVKMPLTDALPKMLAAIIKNQPLNLGYSGVLNFNVLKG